jgi:hypothetical protein
MVTAMSLGRTATVAITLAFLVSPIAAVYCNSSDAASMACCQTDPASCNMPGKSDGCCNKVDNGQANGATVTKMERLEKARPTATSLDLAVAPTVIAVPNLSLTSINGGLSPSASAFLSPPRNSVLRI